MGDSLLDRVTRLPFVIPGDPTGVPASVLLALAPVEGADDLELVLVQRPDHLRQHAGQVGLPGGAVEPGDADGVAAALREAWEEIGLEPAGVRVLGSLDRTYLAVSDFDVLPVVGVWDGLAPLTPSPDEVAGILRPTLRQSALQGLPPVVTHEHDPEQHHRHQAGRSIGREQARTHMPHALRGLLHTGSIGPPTRRMKAPAQTAPTLGAQRPLNTPSGGLPSPIQGLSGAMARIEVPLPASARSVSAE